MKIRKKPEWLNKRLDLKAHTQMGKMLKGLSLNTICAEAACPNISECFSSGRATFLILGTRCTRECTFCNVTKDSPEKPDMQEPANVAKAVEKLGLRHVVITSPTRDDLSDFGAGHFSETVKEIKKLCPETRIELLVPDFQNDRKAVETVLSTKPDIFGHNLETVKRLYSIRKGADYELSLSVLKTALEISPAVITKSGIMLGLGETESETEALMDDLISAGVSYLSMGQYLPPSKKHQELEEFITPELFEKYKNTAIKKGFSHVESAPYVRSSYMADGYK